MTTLETDVNFFQPPKEFRHDFEIISATLFQNYFKLILFHSHVTTVLVKHQVRYSRV